MTQRLLRRRAADVLAALVTLFALAACASARPPEFLATTSGPARPFSPAVKVNGFIYLSGQLGTDSAGTLVTGGIAPETRQTMQNISALLTRSGSSLGRVVKCTVFLADMREWAAMNEVYVTFFAADKRPARSAMGASGLALGARVEIECIAT